MIDFMRRNFAAFDVPLPIWRSSEGLYINLDNLVYGRSWDMSSADRSSFLIKTHELPFSSKGQELLKNLVCRRKVHILTPIRAGESFIESYSRYLQYSFRSSVSLDKEDPYYRNGRTTRRVVEDFLDWTEHHATFVDVQRSVENPDTLAWRLGEIIGEQPRDIKQRLPDRRRWTGKVGELIARLSERGSSEVVVPKSTNIAPPQFPADLEERIERARQTALPCE